MDLVDAAPERPARGAAPLVAGVAVGAVVALASWGLLSSRPTRFESTAEVRFDPAIADAAHQGLDLDPFHAQSVYDRVDREIGRVPAFDVLGRSCEGCFDLVVTGDRDAVRRSATVLATTVAEVHRARIEDVLEVIRDDRDRGRSERAAAERALGEVDDAVTTATATAPVPVGERGSAAGSAVGLGAIGGALAAVAVRRRRAA